MKIRTHLKAGGENMNHNESLHRASDRTAVDMRQHIRTTARKEDRLELLVVRAGLRAGKRCLERYARGRYGR